MYPDEFVVGADTIVEVDGKIIGKPVNEDDNNTLKILSGENIMLLLHIVLLTYLKIDITDYDITKVSFRELSDNMINGIYLLMNLWIRQVPMEYKERSCFVNGINGIFQCNGISIGKFVEKFHI